MNRVLDEIKAAERIAVLSHVPPDGDALGSMLALCAALRHMGKDVQAYSAEISGTYLFMPGIGDIKSVWDQRPHDLAVIVDCADVRLTGQFLPLYKSAKRTMSIDHHMSNAGNGQVSFIDARVSSAAELVLDFIDFAGIPLSADMATDLYVGLSTDTGNFLHSNTNARSFKNAARLAEAGADIQYAVGCLYRRRSLIKTRLIGRAISGMELLEGGRIAFMALDTPDYEALGTDDLDYEGVIDFGRDIDTVEVAVLMRRSKPGKYRVSMRSKDYVNVNAIAQVFGGGGHERASGCMVSGTQQEVRDALLKEITKVL